MKDIARFLSGFKSFQRTSFNDGVTDLPKSKSFETIISRKGL